MSPPIDSNGLNRRTLTSSFWPLEIIYYRQTNNFELSQWRLFTFERRSTSGVRTSASGWDAAVAALVHISSWVRTNVILISNKINGCEWAERILTRSRWGIYSRLGVFSLAQSTSKSGGGHPHQMVNGWLSPGVGPGPNWGVDTLLGRGKVECFCYIFRGGGKTAATVTCM